MCVHDEDDDDGDEQQQYTHRAIQSIDICGLCACICACRSRYNVFRSHSMRSPARVCVWLTVRRSGRESQLKEIPNEEKKNST